MSEENDSPFQKGDAVRHKTGGPKMIYTGAGQYGDAICTWMANGKKQSETFEFEELEPYAPQGPGIAIV